MSRSCLLIRVLASHLFVKELDPGVEFIFAVAAAAAAAVAAAAAAAAVEVLSAV